MCVGTLQLVPAVTECLAVLRYRFCGIILGWAAFSPPFSAALMGLSPASWRGFFVGKEILDQSQSF